MTAPIWQYAELRTAPVAAIIGWPGEKLPHGSKPRCLAASSNEEPSAQLCHTRPCAGGLELNELNFERAFYYLLFCIS